VERAVGIDVITDVTTDVASVESAGKKGTAAVAWVMQRQPFSSWGIGEFCEVS
jgi:hypothetical protein